MSLLVTGVTFSMGKPSTVLCKPRNPSDPTPNRAASNSAVAVVEIDALFASSWTLPSSTSTQLASSPCGIESYSVSSDVASTVVSSAGMKNLIHSRWSPRVNSGTDEPSLNPLRDFVGMSTYKPYSAKSTFW